MSRNPSQNLTVSAKRLVKRYNDVPVVNDLTLEIEEGSFCGILGPNGAGKTTTLRMLIGHCPIDSGTLELFGETVANDPSHIRAQVGVVPQMDNLDPDFTVRENLFVYGRFFGLSEKTLNERILELLSFVSLEEKADSKIAELSGGMKRRLTLARALINNPNLLILDEPTTGLDPQARQAIWQKLRDLKKQGLTLILTTHYMEEAERLCDRVVVMDQGQILADDAPKSLIKTEIETHVLEIEYAEPTLINKIKENAEVNRYEQSGDVHYFYGNKLSQALNDLECENDIEYILRPANLEDVFIKLTGRDLRD